MKNYARGFTVVEILVVIAVLIAAATLFVMQKNELEMVGRDTQRKTAVNAIHQSLEEVFFKQSQFYPEKIDAATLPSVEKSLFTDPKGKQLGDGESDYRYNPAGCNQGKCSSYSLSTTLEKEAEYTKRNR